MVGSAAARELDYSYADVGYRHTNGDPVDVDSGAVDASFGIGRWLALRGQFERGQVSNYPHDTPDLTQFSAGARLHFNLTEGFDVFGDVQYFNLKINGNETTHTDLGFVDEAGIRFALAKSLELNGSYKYVGGGENKSYGTVGAVFDMTREFSLSARAEINSDIQRYFAGVRLNF